jgi:membrane-bound metal-dependent hydrolase YbcI (DUF457 family)
VRLGSTSPDLSRRVRVYSDPLQHAALAALVVAPLAVRTRRRVVGTAVATALVIDLDHVVAARSVRPQDTTGLSARPRTHSLVTAAAVGGMAWAVGGPWHGWAAFAALGSHLLHDAGDRAAPTPLLWPFAPARQVGRRRQLAATAVLVLGSVAISRATAAGSRGPSAAGADAGGAAAHPRTA